MHQQYLVSVALYQHFGHPRIFITMTTNPNWDETQSNFAHDKTPLDQPNLVAKVFKLKKLQLMKD